MSLPLRDFYARISNRYDCINSLMTLGMDRYWRRRAAEKAATLLSSGLKSPRCLDACCGSGKLSEQLRLYLQDDADIFGVDFSSSMLAIAVSKTLADDFLVMASVEALPFDDHSFDLLAMAFASRNLQEAKGGLKRVLGEYRRILKPGGIFLSIETSQPSSKALAKLYHQLVRVILAPLGGLVSGHRAAYLYLAQSMSTFYSPEKFSTILSNEGFGDVSYEPLLFGSLAIHWGRCVK